MRGGESGASEAGLLAAAARVQGLSRGGREDRGIVRPRGGEGGGLRVGGGGDRPFTLTLAHTPCRLRKAAFPRHYFFSFLKNYISLSPPVF